MSNLEIANGAWSGLRQQLRKTWGELTDRDLDAITQDSEQLVQVVLSRYLCGPRQSTETIQGQVPMGKPQLDGDTVSDQAVSNEIDVRT